MDFGTTALTVASPVAGLFKSNHDSAQAAADAQARMLQMQLDEARRTREQALSAAEPTAAELAELHKHIQIKDRAIARQEQLLSTFDPSVMEAGKQALSLMQGKDAAILDPLRRQQQRQRQQLQATLQQRLGSGYATSSAGQAALARFDEQAANSLAGAQQQSITQLAGIAQGGVATSASANYGINAMAGSTAGAYQNFAQRKLQAINQSPITPYAGAPAASDYLHAQADQEFTGSLIKLGSAGAGYIAGGGIPAAKQKAPADGSNTLPSPYQQVS